MSQVVVERLDNSRLTANRQDGFANAQEISARLRAARKKARLNQTELGKIGGVSLNTQGGYENGTLPPLEYFLRIGGAGIDWYWVITGHRIEGESLPDEEAEMVAAFRALPPRFRAFVLRHARELGECANAAPESEG